MVVDVFSNYGWIISLKDKKGETVTEAFKRLFKEREENHNICGSIKAKNSITNIRVRNTCWFSKSRHIKITIKTVQ